MQNVCKKIHQGFRRPTYTKKPFISNIIDMPKHNLVVAKMYNKMYNYGVGNYLHYLREFSNLVADMFD